MPLTLGPQASLLDRDHVLCACVFGCSQSTIQYKGKVLQGRVFSRKNYTRHLQKANEPLATPAHLPPGQDPHPPTQHSGVSILGNLDISLDTDSCLSHPTRAPS
jgi:hypothetical protein